MPGRRKPRRRTTTWTSGRRRKERRYFCLPTSQNFRDSDNVDVNIILFSEHLHNLLKYIEIHQHISRKTFWKTCLNKGIISMYHLVEFRRQRRRRKSRRRSRQRMSPPTSARRRRRKTRNLLTGRRRRRTERRRPTRQRTSPGGRPFRAEGWGRLSKNQIEIKYISV